MDKTILKYLADDGVTWVPFTGDVPAPSSSIVVKGVPLGTKDGSNQVFTTPQPYVGGTLQLYINGLAQSGFVTETDPLTGVFSVDPAPAASDDLSVYFHVANTGVGNADTVDNFHASPVPAANTIPVLGSDGRLPSPLQPKVWSGKIDIGTTGLHKVDVGFRPVEITTDRVAGSDLANGAPPAATYGGSLKGQATVNSDGSIYQYCVGDSTHMTSTSSSNQRVYHSGTRIYHWYNETGSEFARVSVDSVDDTGITFNVEFLSGSRRFDVFCTVRGIA